MHCPYKHLADLKDCLTEIRRLPGMLEPRPGIFYFGRTAFLHFHLKDDVRSADVRVGNDWGSVVAIPIGAGAKLKQRFLSVVRRRYKATVVALGLPSKQIKQFRVGRRAAP